MKNSQDMDDSKDYKTSLLKRFLKYMWGNSPLPEILAVDIKLNQFDNILNINWYVFLLISFGTFMLDTRIQTFLVMALPTLLFAFSSLLILLRKGFGNQRFIRLGLTILMMFMIQEWVDLPAYLKKEYKVVEGFPTKFEFYDARKGPNYWEVVVDDIKFSMPEEIKTGSSNKWFVIKYLPHSKFILEYKILTVEET